MEMKNTIFLKGSNLSFLSEKSLTILEAGLNSSLNLPHGCKSGACGTCSVKLTNGSIKKLDGSKISYDKYKKKILLCQSIADSSEITIEYPSHVMNNLLLKNKRIPIKPKELFLEVISNKQTTPIVKELQLLVPEKLNFRFEAGMHVDIICKELDLVRKYSICNSPNVNMQASKNMLRFLIAKHNEDGLSAFLSRKVLPGDILHIKGPYNSFIFEEEYERPIIAIAGGTGIAPILSILKSFLKKDKNLSVLVLLSVRSRQEILEMDSLHNMRQKYKNFSFKITLTRESFNAANRFLFGRVEKVLPKIFSNLSNHNVFICGSDGFVIHSKKSVIDLNADINRIYSETFS